MQPAPPLVPHGVASQQAHSLGQDPLSQAQRLSACPWVMRSSTETRPTEATATLPRVLQRTLQQVISRCEKLIAGVEGMLGSPLATAPVATGGEGRL